MHRDLVDAGFSSDISVETVAPARIFDQPNVNLIHAITGLYVVGNILGFNSETSNFYLMVSTSNKFQLPRGQPSR